jgi:hypothetical protein
LPFTLYRFVFQHLFPFAPLGLGAIIVYLFGLGFGACSLGFFLLSSIQYPKSKIKNAAPVPCMSLSVPNAVRDYPGS